MKSTILKNGLVEVKIEDAVVLYYTLEEYEKLIKKQTLDDLVNEMKSRYLHMVGTQFDNALLEMEKIAEKLKQ